MYEIDVAYTKKQCADLMVSGCEVVNQANIVTADNADSDLHYQVFALSFFKGNVFHLIYPTLWMIDITFFKYQKYVKNRYNSYG